MRATQSATWLLLLWILCGPLSAAGQGTSNKRSTTQKMANPAEQAATLAQEVKRYEALLQNPDVAASRDLASALREKWIAASCQLEVLGVAHLDDAKSSLCG